MRLGRVIGKVWATVKDPRLVGIKLYILQPVDENDQPDGKAVVAADIVSSREGDLVFWVGAAEATFPFKDRPIPSDVSIVGLVERVNT